MGICREMEKHGNYNIGYKILEKEIATSQLLWACGIERLKLQGMYTNCLFGMFYGLACPGIDYRVLTIWHILHIPLYNT